MGARLEQWITSLITSGLIVETGEPKLQDGSAGYTLAVPVSIRISSHVLERLRKRYRIDREIGGIFLAEAMKEEAKNILVVKRIRFIRNVSKNPKREYLPNGDRIQQMHRCLSGTKGGRHYLPIWFHSHPIRDQNHTDAIMSYFEMQNSPQDMKIATKGITYSSLKMSLFFPSALTLVTADGALFVGIYGGYVAPDNLRRAVIEILSQPMIGLAESAIDWGFEEGASNWRKFGGIIGAAGAVFAFAASGMSLESGQPELVAQVNEMALNFQKGKGEKNYLGISKQGELRINLPERRKK